MCLGEWAQLSSELSEAVRAWREVADGHRLAGDIAPAAGVERHLAGIYEVQAGWESAMETRQAAADAFASASMLADAAVERLVTAAHPRSAASFHAALALLEVASPEAETAGRLDLQTRILALRGNVPARFGRAEEGLGDVRAGLALALEHNLTVAATEIYQRLADSLEHPGDYTAAQRAYGEAAGYCETQGAEATAQLCDRPPPGPLVLTFPDDLTGVLQVGM